MTQLTSRLKSFKGFFQKKYRVCSLHGKLHYFKTLTVRTLKQCNIIKLFLGTGQESYGRLGERGAYYDEYGICI